MVIAPHPDDVEIGMGGTVLALVDGGHEVVLVDLTNGEPTPHGTPERRKEEMRHATEILGVSQRVTLDLKNREVFDTVENRKKVASVIREYKPEILFGPYWEDGHPDHVQACQLVESARFYAKFVKSDMPHEPHYPRKLIHFISTHIRPKLFASFVFDISHYIDHKMEAIAAYRSQFVENEKNRHVLELIRSENAHWGFQVGTKFAEPFVMREHLRLTSAESLLHV